MRYKNKTREYTIKYPVGVDRRDLLHFGIELGKLLAVEDLWELGYIKKRDLAKLHTFRNIIGAKLAVCEREIDCTYKLDGL